MKHATILMLVLLLFALPVLSGCGASATDLMGTVTPAPAPAEAQPVPQDYVDAATDFAWDLLRTSGQEGEGILLSPASVHLALSMTLNGADTDTKEQMRLRLGGPDLSTDALNQSARATLDRWNTATGEDRLSIANSIWFDQLFEPDPSFLQANADYYTAAARKLDFRNTDAVKTINDWVREATRGVIPDILDDIPVDVVLYLVNAIHFKAEWKDPFDPQFTRDGLFHASSQDIEADFMNRTGAMRYLEKDGIQSVLLPYGGDRFAFFAMLPDRDISPVQLLQTRDNTFLNDQVRSLLDSDADTQVSLSLPRFEVEYKDSLVNELEQMGMADAFDPAKADFSQMNAAHDRNLFISDVLHKTFCKVDEKGTEAAAATAVEMTLTGMPAQGIPLRLDRPFLYGIVDLETGIPLFLGALENPAG